MEIGKASLSLLSSVLVRGDSIKGARNVVKATRVPWKAAEITMQLSSVGCKSWLDIAPCLRTSPAFLECFAEW